MFDQATVPTTERSDDACGLLRGHVSPELLELDDELETLLVDFEEDEELETLLVDLLLDEDDEELETLLVDFDDDDEEETELVDLLLNDELLEDSSSGMKKSGSDFWAYSSHRVRKSHSPSASSADSARL